MSRPLKDSPSLDMCKIFLHIFYMPSHKPPLFSFFFFLSCLLSLYLPFSLCSSLIGWIYPLVHVCSLHHVMCIFLAGVLPLSHWFSVTVRSQCECVLFVVNLYFIYPSGWSNHEHLIWNISSTGCRSDKKIVLWKFTRGPFPSISRNCNLRKAKWRVTQKSTRNPLAAFAFVGSGLVSCDPCRGGLQTSRPFEDSLRCGAGAQDNLVLSDAVFAVQRQSYVCMFSLKKFRSAPMQIHDSQKSRRLFN